MWSKRESGDELVWLTENWYMQMTCLLCLAVAAKSRSGNDEWEMKDQALQMLIMLHVSC